MVGKLKIGAITVIAGTTMMLSAAMHEKGSTVVPKSVSGGDSCVKCHKGIESIRDPKSDMMKQIVAMGKGMGDSGGCVVCHGGNPKAGTAEEAHKGAPKAHPGGLTAFVRDPGSYWIMDKTCGLCHADTVANMKKALMATEAGKIQGNLHTWGTEPTMKVKFANYDIKDEDGAKPAWGTDTYKKYMLAMIHKFPDQFPTELKQLPPPPKSDAQLEKKPGESEAAYQARVAYHASITYQRSDCQRCHIGVRGRKGRGDWRGMGCSACHIPYGNEGFYEGGDPTIDKKEHGHLLVHEMQASREAKVHVPSTGVTFSGIHPETCNSCHNRGKRIGVSYMGLMEQPYSSPLMPGGKAQLKTHGKRYKHIKEDLHFKAGMTCQDCHTSIDMHGDGTLYGSTLGQVEIECSDCHGTTRKYPWELRMGYGEKEFAMGAPKGPRGLSKKLPAWMQQGTVYKPMDGYLLTTRGNPFGNVVKKGNKVIVHLASGKDLEVPLLKNKEKKKQLSEAGEVAMHQVKAHMDKLECYSCHSDWAPQCYGCHVKVDYTKGKSKIDWIASGSTHFANGETSESVLGTHGKKQIGKAHETRSYLRWEDPILGINGEGLVTPIIPGCQVTYTIIGPDGQTVVLNKQARVMDNGLKVDAIDMSPVQPHTTGKKARSCESCHSNPKALGYGIADGQFLTDQDKDLKVDLQDLATGKFASKHTTIQIKAIPGMNFDWSKVVDRKTGKQIVNVGSHWPASRALDKEMRDKMERTGVCMGCHKNMTKEKLWSKVNRTPGILSDKQHQEVMDKLLHAGAKSGLK
ncbi:cytochrome C [Nitratifractor sp.]|uniref:cytochrome C n=1 Tax=Nitratifractor sp. TaxID=2268144 RepID=UPI0025D95962|nr:cytochrome C [Nitratifractor sp.]